MKLGFTLKVGHSLMQMCLFGLILGVSSCTEGVKLKTGKAGNNKQGQPSSSRTEHTGGDQIAWLSANGDNADSNNCRTNLKLPFATEPAWIQEYSDATFSSFPPAEIVHYDGVLYIAAWTTQIMGLDSSTGEVLFNKDVYLDSGSLERVKRIQTLFLHPEGWLSARDNLFRVYCWDTSQQDLEEQWVFSEGIGRGGIVAQGTKFFVGDKGKVLGIDIAGGTITFEYPSLFDNAGMLLSESGMLICWPFNGNKLVALETASQQTKWVAFLDSPIFSSAINDDLGCVYALTQNEELTCLDLQTGTQLWKYSWSWVIDQDERLEVTSQITQPLGEIRCSSPIASPKGICLALFSGDVLMLSPTGELLWHYEADSSISTVRGFENAILVKQFWEDHQEFWRGRMSPYNLTRPNWPVITTALENFQRLESDENQPSQTLGPFARIVALSLVDGSELDSFEPEEFPFGTLVPAYGNIVFGQAVGFRRRGRQLGLTKRVVAYNWLEEGGK